MLEEAKERLIQSRATHLDQLADKLKEERVRRVIEPIFTGADSLATEEDEQYCIDLGLVKLKDRKLVISNEIYKEVLPRELTYAIQRRMESYLDPDWVNADGTLNSETLFRMFQEFWRENSEIWSAAMAGYVEAAPHLVFQAFLQRVANGSGFIAREFAYGTKRADLMLKWRHPNGEQRIVIELKLLTERDSYESLKAKALEQTAAYAVLCDATEAHIAIFDRCGRTDWKEQLFRDSGEYDGMFITIWGM